MGINDFILALLLILSFPGTLTFTQSSASSVLHGPTDRSTLKKNTRSHASFQISSKWLFNNWRVSFFPLNFNYGFTSNFPELCFAFLTWIQLPVFEACWFYSSIFVTFVFVFQCSRSLFDAVPYLLWTSSDIVFYSLHVTLNLLIPVSYSPVFWVLRTFWVLRINFNLTRKELSFLPVYFAQCLKRVK